jgi:hypothetical protein
MVQTIAGDFVEVGLSDPSRPVRVEQILSGRLAKRLTKCKFIRPRPEKQGRSNPWLKDKPTAEIYAPDLGVIIIEAQTLLREPGAMLVKHCNQYGGTHVQWTSSCDGETCCDGEVLQGCLHRVEKYSVVVELTK